jgi:hypothetical protein
MRFTSTLLALITVGVFDAHALAQDSVSKLHAVPGDALDAHSAAEQINDFVVDQAALHTSWGNAFGVAPIIKVSAEKVLSPSFYTGQESAQALSRLTKANTPFVRTSYSLWNGQGFGVNDNASKNDPGTPINTASFKGYQFGCAFSEFSTGNTNPVGLNAPLNNVIGGLVNFQSALPSRLYVSRINAAVNGINDGCNLAAFGFGDVDEDGNVHFRADNFNAADCGGGLALLGQNLFRVQMLSRTAGVVNVIGDGGPTDAGATTWMLAHDSATTLDCPTSIPKSVQGSRPIVISTNFTTQYVFESVSGSLTVDGVGAHLATGATDHRGNLGYSPFNFTSLFGAAATDGTAGQVAKGTGTLTDTLNLFGLDSTGQFVGPIARVLPAAISDCDQPSWSSTNVPGTQQFDNYHGSIAFNGGNGQVAIGKDQAGNMVAAATVYYGGVSNTDRNSYIAVLRTTPAGVTTWSVAGWTQETTTPLVSDGKIIYQNGTTPIGRLTGALFGPPLSSPMVDSVGNVWFLAATTLNGPPATSQVGLIRAVYNPASGCYKLELVMKEGDVFSGRNSTTNYKVSFLNVSGATTVSPGGAWSGNISSSAFENLNPATLSTQDPRTLGGLAISAGIIYDVNNDGQFIKSTGPNGVPGSPDEDYQVLLYISASKDCNNNGVPDDADIFNHTSTDADADGVPDECQSPGPGVAFCFPGQNGIIPCPCSNPGGYGRGCDNSSSTTGAHLEASGTPSLSADTLSFSCNGEKPTANSILLQAQLPELTTGLKFGMGVRCLNVQLKRLYLHAASGGTVVYPQGADLPVHLQSAAKGDTITPGTRLYLSYYRDPSVLPGCLMTDTFNASQGVAIVWAP